MAYPVRPVPPEPYDPLRPVARVAPYGWLPYRGHHGGGNGDFVWSRHLRRAAAGALKWLNAAKSVREAISGLRVGAVSVWQQRSVASSAPAAVDGEADYGTPRRRFRLQIDALARSQRNEGYALVKHGESAIEAGVHTFTIASAGLTRDITAFIRATDSNGQALGKLCDAINEARAGVTAELITGSESYTARLALTADKTGTGHAFTIADKWGSAVAASGIGTVSRPAADAAYRLDGGDVEQSPINAITLDGGRIRLTLKAETAEPVSLLIGFDFEAALRQTAHAVYAVNELAAVFDSYAGYLDPALARALKQAMSSERALRIGVKQDSPAGSRWRLDEEQLRQAFAERPVETERELSGQDGWATELGQLLDAQAALPAEALFHPTSRTLQLYAQYSADRQTYMPMPSNGWVLDNIL